MNIGNSPFLSRVFDASSRFGRYRLLLSTEIHTLDGCCFPSRSSWFLDGLPSDTVTSQLKTVLLPALIPPPSFSVSPRVAAVVALRPTRFILSLEEATATVCLFS
jgi:hypothetical protein